MPTTLTLDAYLIFRALGQLCALSAEHVDETMRPLKLLPIDSAPSFVAGLSVIRGIAYPIVDLRKFFGIDANELPKRLIAIRVGETRRVGLLVDEVLGLRPASALGLQPLPPILRMARSEVIESLSMLDGELLQVLRKGQFVPDSVWESAADPGGLS